MAVASRKMETIETHDMDRYRAPALDKGFDVLEILADENGGLTRSEISRLLGKSTSEIYRVLDRLQTRQYVVHSTVGGRYSLGLKLYALAHRYPPMNRLIAEALPLIQHVADAAGQSCHLTVYDRADLLVIAQVDGPGPCAISVRLGARVGLIDTSSGRTMLAFQTPEQREHMLSEYARLNGEVAIDREMLQADYEQIRAAGFSQTDSQQFLGITDITFPLYGPSGQAIATLTCPCLRRIDERAAPPLDAVRKMLADTASRLSMLSEPARAVDPTV